MSQVQRVLDALRLEPMCGTDFLRMYVPRYSARILELRQAGYEIISRPCRFHDHENPQTVYELVGRDQGRLFA